MFDLATPFGEHVARRLRDTWMRGPDYIGASREALARGFSVALRVTPTGLRGNV